jgi:hypothetical protein
VTRKLSFIISSLHETLSGYSELLGFWTFSIVWYSRDYKTQCFGNWICFRHLVRGEDTYSVGSLRKREIQPSNNPCSELLYDWQFTANQFVLATSPLRPMTKIFIFQLNTCGYRPYVISSLTRGWVCRL